MKKEFVSYWSGQHVTVDTSKMPITSAQFFKEVQNGRGRFAEIVTPDSVRYDDLAVFMGRKTKITIETLD